jgi:hypothetical protein
MSYRLLEVDKVKKNYRTAPAPMKIYEAKE